MHDNTSLQVLQAGLTRPASNPRDRAALRFRAHARFVPGAGGRCAHVVYAPALAEPRAPRGGGAGGRARCRVRGCLVRLPGGAVRHAARPRRVRATRPAGAVAFLGRALLLLADTARHLAAGKSDYVGIWLLDGSSACELGKREFGYHF